MKNKKLFAILTLVCFMFTLMPVAAFATTPEYVFVKGADGVWGDDVTVKAETAFDVDVAATTESAATAGIKADTAFYAVDEDGVGVAVSTDGKLTIMEEGSYEVYAVVYGTKTAVKTYLEEVGDPAEKVQTLEKYYAELILADFAEVVVESDELVYKIELTEDADYAAKANLTGNVTAGYDMDIKANNGFNKDGYLVATLYSKVKGADDSTYKAVKAGYELTITEAGYIDVTAKTLETDKKGQVKFNVTADLANVGNKVIVKYGKAKVELTVDANVTDVAKVVVNAEPTAPVNDDASVFAAEVEFKFTDADGVAANVVPADYAIAILEQPANSKMKPVNFKLEADDEGKAGVYDLKHATTDGKFAKEGTYVIEVSLENGSSAKATVEVAEMGDVVAIKFVKAPVTVPVGTTTQVKKVVAVDANGVTEDVTARVVMSANGTAISNFYQAPVVGTGVLVAKDDVDYVGSTITVMAVLDKEFVATTNIQVTNSAATVKYMNNKAEVGVSTEMKAMIYDEVGKMSGTGTRVEDTTVEVIVIDKPENAVAVATCDPTLDSKAMVVMNFLASQAGEYKVQTIVTYPVYGPDGDDAGTDPDVIGKKYISGIETITVGGGMNAFDDVVVLSMGAKSMIVNDEVVALDVAPFVAEGRTMMQYTALKAFGIEFNWDGVDTVTAEGNGVKVVMTIGSKVATVNGKVVNMEVAPTIIDGRTVIPVTYATNPFGITATALYDANGVSDVLFTK